MKGRRREQEDTRSSEWQALTIYYGYILPVGFYHRFNQLSLLELYFVLCRFLMILKMHCKAVSNYREVCRNGEHSYWFVYYLYLHGFQLLTAWKGCACAEHTRQKVIYCIPLSLFARTFQCKLFGGWRWIHSQSEFVLVGSNLVCLERPWGRYTPTRQLRPIVGLLCTYELSTKLVWYFQFVWVDRLLSTICVYMSSLLE